MAIISMMKNANQKDNLAKNTYKIHMICAINERKIVLVIFRTAGSNFA